MTADPIVNWTPTNDGPKARAVCEFCDRRSRPIVVSGDGRPSLWDMPQGWSTAPYPVSFVHDDGSSGSTFTCPECNSLLDAGVSLPVADRRQAARRSRASTP